MSKKYFALTVIPFGIAFPSVLTGIVIMYIQGISATIYMQKLISFVVGGILSGFCILKVRNISVKFIYTSLYIGVFALLSTFLFGKIDGVCRWIFIGNITINAAFIFIPVLLIGISRHTELGKQNICNIFIFVIALILFLQPDASMISAFSIAVLPFLYAKHVSKFTMFIMPIVLLILSAISFINIISYFMD